MKNKERFDKSIQILSNAYFNDKLISCRCTACAVGNLIVGNGFSLKFVYEKNAEEASKSNAAEHWLRYIEKYVRNRNFISEWLNEEVALAQINASGYTPEDLSKIESAFEKAKQVSDDLMFDRLMAVVEVLQQIHKCSEEETTIAKGKFNKQSNLIEV